MNGKCPKCEKTLTSANIAGIDLSAGPGSTKWNGNAYVCPYCQTILGVQIDPIAIMSDTVQKILARLGR